MAALLPFRSAPVEPLMFQVRALASSVHFFGLMKIWTLAELFPSATGKAYLVPHTTAGEKAASDWPPCLPLRRAAVYNEQEENAISDRKFCRCELNNEPVREA
jgi:hypothetical protein